MESEVDTTPLGLTEARGREVWTGGEVAGGDLCVKCYEPMAANLLTAMFGVHYDCFREELRELEVMTIPCEKCDRCGLGGACICDGFPDESSELSGHRFLERVRDRLYERLEEMERGGVLNPRNKDARAVNSAITLVTSIISPAPAILPRDRWA